MTQIKKLRIGKKAAIALLTIMAMAAAIFALFIIRPELRFYIETAISTAITQVRVDKVTYSKDELSRFTIDELKNREDVDYNNSLILVNAQNPISEQVELNISEYKQTGLLMDKCIMQAFSDMGQEIKSKYSKTLYVMSSYRTPDEQQDLYEQDSKIAMVPGSSEHETGMALDVYISGFAGSGFIKSKVGMFVNKSCWKYGFIVRYQSDKQNITGIDYEPWHIRYVGKPHAEIMYYNSMCLEEYILSLEAGAFYKACGYIISRQTGANIEIPHGVTDISVSPDNMGGYIITAKSE